MILKEADDQSDSIQALEQLLETAPANIKSKVKTELVMLRSGISGEAESAFHLNDFFKDSKNIYIIHDLRLEHNGRVAQIDHLLINRFLEVYVLETKRLHAGMKISEIGEFSQWINKTGTYAGMASPLAQNRRHIDVLKDIFRDEVELPKKLGFTLKPKFHSRILVNAKARIIRPKKFDTSEIVKADDFFNAYQKAFDEVGFLDAMSGLANTVSSEQVYYLSRKLISLHKPIKVDYLAKFGIKAETKQDKTYSNEKVDKPSKAKQSAASYTAKVCLKCKSEKLNIDYGRYGYYFKCLDCGEGTSIKLDCDVKACKARIRKSGNQFFRECADCQSSSLYFENKT